ncbi:MAG: pilus assembly protein TadG-related protein, partial [Janthinobacterium lividum]
MTQPVAFPRDAGVIAPATAVVMAVLIGMLGMVTDTSVWYAQRRQLQGVTDAAALAAARFANDDAAARAAASAVFVSNGLDPVAVMTDIKTGSYCPDIATSVSARFQVAACTGSSTTVRNAVRLTTTVDSPLFLSGMSITGNRHIGTISTAARVNQAGLEAGSGLVALDGGIANAVLSALTGGSISLTAVQYNGLLTTKVDTLSFLDALATKLNLTAGTYSSLLASNIGVGDLVAAEIAVLGQQQQTADVAAAIAGLTAIKSQISGNQTIAIGKLFDLGLWGNTPIGDATSTSALHAGLNLWQLTSFSLQLANGSHAATIPPSSVGVPGLATLKVTATAI